MRTAAIITALTFITACGGYDADQNISQTEMAAKPPKPEDPICPEGQVPGKKGACNWDSDLCFDGVDNDGNGLTDCDDPNCAPLTDCNPYLQPGEYNTQNFCSGYWDEATLTCDVILDSFFLIQLHPENCSDSADNDGNGDVDCSDLNCHVTYRDMFSYETVPPPCS